MRRFIRKFLKGASLTAALFVFQACYGTPVPPAAAEDEAIVQDQENSDQTKNESPVVETLPEK